MKISSGFAWMGRRERCLYGNANKSHLPWSSARIFPGTALVTEKTWLQIPSFSGIRSSAYQRGGSNICRDWYIGHPVCMRNRGTTLLLPVVLLFIVFVLHENKGATAAICSHVVDYECHHCCIHWSARRCCTTSELRVLLLLLYECALLLPANRSCYYYR